MAYVAYRLPATFAAAHASLTEVRRLKPDWEPSTLLDLGGGPGTAAWVATSLWPSIRQVTIVEQDVHMIQAGRELAAGSVRPALRQAQWLETDITGVRVSEPADLVTAAYVLGELPDTDVDSTVASWWRSAADTLVAIEPGTPIGYSHIIRTRQRLLRDGATTVAPCPHDRPCPLRPTDWCHFSQRLPRSRVHRSAKDGTLSYEDEKYSYAAMSRHPAIDVTARVIRRPHSARGLVRLVLCTEDGLETPVITRRDGEVFKRARRLTWGSAVFADQTESGQTT
jgi:ribosomal protein RSM22 (predicted rRNA methylase)